MRCSSTIAWLLLVGWMAGAGTVATAQKPERPITVHVFLSANPGESQPPAMRLNQTHIGFPIESVRKSLRIWTSDEHGQITVDGLKVGAHIAIAQADAANATILPVFVPQPRGSHIQRLRPLPAWANADVAPRPEIVAKVVGTGEDERIEFTITNRTSKPHRVSEYDLQLASDSLQLRVFPNPMVQGQLPGIPASQIAAIGWPRADECELAPNESLTRTLRWPDLVRRGLWVVRREETPNMADGSTHGTGIPAENGRTAFQTCSGQIVWLTNPEQIRK